MYFSSSLVWSPLHISVLNIHQSLSTKHCPVIDFFHLESLTVYSICSFWQLTGIWGVVPHPLRSQKPLDVWPWKFYQNSSSVRRHEIRKKFERTWLVCKLQTKIPKNQIFRKAYFRHSNITKFCRIVTIDVRNNPQNFRSIFQNNL